jgi:endo-1,3(4)-beta-glucanase
MKKKYPIMKKNYQNIFSVLALILCVTFSQFSNAQCSFTDTANSGADDTFSTGYKYSEQTVGNKVVITAELLDTDKGNVVAYMFRLNSPDATHPYENGMTSLGNNKFTVDYILKSGETSINFQIKFTAYPGVAPHPAGMAVTKIISYTVGDLCGGTVSDTSAPTGFSAQVGTASTSITTNSVELLVNGSDDSGNVIYEATATPGGATATVTGAGPQSLIVQGLNQNTAYTFSVTAKDAAGNSAANSPYTNGLTATTLVDTSTPCGGTSTQAQSGAFTTGYTYSVTTSGNNVTISVTVLDDVANIGTPFFWCSTLPGDRAISKDGKTASFTFTAAANDVIDWNIKFAGLHGDTQTKTFTYKFGNEPCTTSLGIEDQQLSNNDVKLYPNPANKGNVTVEAGDLKVSKVEVFSILGSKVLETKNASFSTSNLQSGVYFVKISAEGKSVTKKLIVN